MPALLPLCSLTCRPGGRGASPETAPSAKREMKHSGNNDLFSSASLFKVLGYLNRNALDTKNLIKEIKAIASNPTERYFFNVSDEAALLEKAGTIGEHIFSIEGKRTPLYGFLSKPAFPDSCFHHHIRAP